MWETLQSGFAKALLDLRAPPPEGCSEKITAVRFGVYRNNFVSGLAAALAVRFPATQRIVGEEFFAAMAGEFVLRHPPSSPVLLDYGSNFLEFVERFAPARRLAYLPDVMRLEDARVRAYHAADAEPIPPRDLAAIPHAQVEKLAFHIHPAAAVVRSRHPIVTIWAMNPGERELGPIDEWSGEDALVSRPARNVQAQRLSPGVAFFLQRLVSGATLGAAVRAAKRRAPTFDLAEALTVVLRAGVVTAFRAQS